MLEHKNLGAEILRNIASDFSEKLNKALVKFDDPERLKKAGALEEVVTVLNTTAVILEKKVQSRT